ncbi:MAG TPA: tetratricopeptide repeat protein [Terracidiphilus sp.]|nr:tetratricopeptide repeat protein [Terracidiphilus sp.]
MQTYLSFRWRAIRRYAVALLGAVLAVFGTAHVSAQATGAVTAESATAGRGRILLVLQFDNKSGQPSLEWIREAAPEILSRRFASAGFAPMSREDRLYALDHLGLPEGFQPSRASALKLAETLDADSIVVGSFKTSGTEIEAEAQVVDVPHLRMSAPVTAQGEMRNMVDVFDSLAWKLTRVMDPGFSVAEETFVAAGKGLRLDAFEQYIRGITEPDQAERLRHLQMAVKLSPDFGEAWMALGREDYSGAQYEQAADAFAKVGRNNPDALEAGFYRGLSLLFSGNYPQAQQAFTGVAEELPLAEVLNNEGVAISRQGKDGSAFFRKAVAADPNVADYHFNLAVSLKRNGDSAEAQAELARCLKLRPSDSEAQDLEEAWEGKPAPAAGSDASGDADAKPDPLERIVRTFDAVAFKQAAQMLEEVEAAKLAALSPHDRAVKLSSQAKDYLDRGLLLEAERLYRSAVADDGKLAEAHAGLAEVQERTGDETGARKEAQKALELGPTADAYLVMGRLDFAANHLDEANKEAGEALRLDPGSKGAQDLSRQIEAKAGQKQ